MRNFLSSMFTLGIGIVFSSGLFAAPAQLNLQETNSTMLPITQKRIAEKQPVRVVIYGDSISEVKPGWSGGAAGPAQNWGAQLVNRLHQKYPATEFTVTPFGIGGQNSYEGLGRLDGLAALKPDLVLVAFGANDCCHHYLLPEETQLALSTLVTAIQQRFGADVLLVGTGGDNPVQPFFHHLAETLTAQRTAATEAKAVFVDIRHAILAATENGKRWAEYHLGAGNCHPNHAGHQIWAETVFEAICAALKRTAGLPE